MERRTVSGEDRASVARETEDLLARLRHDDAEFEARATVTAYRPAYRLDASHALPAGDGPGARGRRARSPIRPACRSGLTPRSLPAPGIPSILFGPGGAGLHSREEYVNVEDVRVCRDVLVKTTRNLVGL